MGNGFGAAWGRCGAAWRNSVNAGFEEAFLCFDFFLTMETCRFWKAIVISEVLQPS
jgi:hypothetical protein